MRAPWALCAALLLPQPARGESRSPFRVVEGFVDYRNHSGPPVKRSIVEMTGSGVCVLDYDLDGALDVYFTDGGSPDDPTLTNRLFRNRGDLAFEDVTEEARVGDTGWAGGCAVGDIDDDGDPDLYVTNTGPNVLYRNNGDGSFERVEAQAGVAHGGFSTGAAFGDLDGDGLLNLYVANYIDLDRVDLSARCRYFGLSVYCGPNGLPGQADVLYQGLDGRRFLDVTVASGVWAPDTRGFSVLLTDLDGDRLPEIHVANDATRDLLFRNLGGMRFEDVSLLSGAAYSGSGMEQSGMGSSAGDFDADGDLNLYVTNFQRDYNTLFVNGSGLHFQDETVARGLGLPTLSYLGWSALFLDANNDGILDIFVANGHIYPELLDRPEIREPYAQRNQLFFGDGSGGFSEVELDGVAKVSRGAALGDLNGDGALDVVVNNLDDTPTLYLGRPQGTWLRLELIGTRTNRDGLGAKVRWGDGGRAQVVELRGSDGYLGSNELVVHLGLEESAAPVTLVVEWPSGRDNRLEALDPGRGYRVKEGFGWLR